MKKGKRILIFMFIFCCFLNLGMGDFSFVFAEEIVEKTEQDFIIEDLEQEIPDAETPDEESPEEGAGSTPEEDIEINIPNLVVETVKNDGGYLVRDEDGAYYFDNFLTIEFLIEEQKDEIEDTEEQELEKEVVIKRNEGEIYRGNAKEVEDHLIEEGIYTYTIEDIEGNRREENIVITAKHSDAVPEAEIFCIPEMQLLEDGGYLNAKQFEEFDIVGNIKDELGIAKIAYKADGEEEYKILLEVLDASFLPTYQDSLLLGTLKEELEHPKDGAYTYMFEVTNCLGNVIEKTITFQLDRTAPEEEIYISYISDREQNTGILDFLRTSLKKIFGKQEIQFDLYVKDSYAGIDTEDLKKQIFLKQGSGTLEDLEVLSEKEASFEFAGKYYEGYTQIRGCFTSLASNVENQLFIKRLSDRVGNYLEKIEMEDITGVSILYLDSVNPQFSIDYRNEEVILQNNIEKRFYKTDTKIPLKILEAYYEKQTDENGNIVEPKIEFLGEHQISLPSWNLSEFGKDADDHAKAELFFPCNLDEEREYQFRVSYQDGSGNLMQMSENNSGEMKAGIFTSQVLVLDGRAPKLLSCEIETAENMEISFSLDERPMDWEINKQRLQFEIIEEESQRVVKKLTGEDFVWEDRERVHSTKYVFEGEENIASNYFIKISYQDCANNKLAAGEDLKGGVIEQGTYISDVVFLDCKAPIFHISYNLANRLVNRKNSEKENDKLHTYPETGYHAYYQDDILVSFSIEEISANPIYEQGLLIGLEDFELKINGSTQNLPKIIWLKMGQIYKGSFALKKEDTYCIEIQYMDSVKNKMEAGVVQANQAGEQLVNGIYQSEYVTIDKSAPLIRISYVNASFREINPQKVQQKTGRCYFGEEIYLQLHIQDKNLRYGELKEVLEKIEAFDIEKTVIIPNSASVFIDGLDGSIIREDEFVVEIPLISEANYNIPINCVDLAGNEMSFNTQYVTIDKQKPELELSYEMSESTYRDVINYKDLGFLFADHKISITASSKDQTAGIYQIGFLVTDENGKESMDTYEFEAAASGSYTMVLPLSGDDFKGTVKAEVLDWANHKMEKSLAYIIESDSKHENTKDIALNTYTAPSRVVNGKNYYNTDIKLNVSFKDSYSGLKNLEYTIGDLSKSIDYAKKAGNSLENEAKEEITYEYSEDIILSAASNNQNDVPIQMSFTDNAGHKETFADVYQIDMTVPIIEVEYDVNNPENQSYYASARKAIVTIQERNFDENDVNFIITNTDGVMPLIGEWKHEEKGDESRHSCEILFSEDGDYTFTVEFQDMAGNKAEYQRVDEFTIDQTFPILTVSYDNSDGKNEHYYAKSRIATIDIEEHNFDASLIEVVITAEKTQAAVPVLSAWHQQGDHYIATVQFLADAEYSFGISGKDLAGNSLEAYEQDYFIIDQTVPELEITNILDRSANNGEVKATIRYSDINYDTTGVEILFTGYQNGVQNIKQIRSQSGDTVEIQLEDFPYTKEMDDMYSMEVYVQDKAGNHNEANILFSVNRFGSVYTFDKETENLLQTYYTKQEQDMIITETNVDTLEFQKITCNYNGNLSVLEFGKDYTVKESGTQESWKQYTYEIAKQNFQEEGIYILTIYSEDRAKNISDNYSKGKKVEFVVDKTKPSILISGVEHEMQYRENSREVTLDIQDNLQLKQVEVMINDEKLVYTKEELQEKNGRLTILLGSKNHWQTMYVKAIDAAGNQTDSEKLQFLITANIFVQFVMNTRLLSETVSGMVILGSGMVYWRKFSRRNNG